MNIRGVGLQRVQQEKSIAVPVPSQQKFHLNNTIKSWSLALFLVSTASNISYLEAASQGSLGATSSGSFTITLTVYPTLSTQSFSVANATEEPTLNASTVSETDRKTQTATPVLPGSQTISAAEENNPKKEKTAPAEKALTKIKPSKKQQQHICVKGNGMSNYSLQASGSRTDNRMVLSANNGSQISYQVMLTDQSNPTPINLQQAKTLPLNNNIDCGESPVVSIKLSDAARNSLGNNPYYGAAQVIVSAE